jgi:hypothetical protein
MIDNFSKNIKSPGYRVASGASLLLLPTLSARPGFAVAASIVAKGLLQICSPSRTRGEGRRDYLVTIGEKRRLAHNAAARPRRKLQQRSTVERSVEQKTKLRDRRCNNQYTQLLSTGIF